MARNSTFPSGKTVQVPKDDYSVSSSKTSHPFVSTAATASPTCIIRAMQGNVHHDLVLQKSPGLTRYLYKRRVSAQNTHPANNTAATAPLTPTPHPAKALHAAPPDSAWPALLPIPPTPPISAVEVVAADVFIGRTTGTCDTS